MARRGMGQTVLDLEREIRRIDGRGYKAYKDLRDKSSVVRGVRVTPRRIQGDPFAPPSTIELEFNLGRLPRECKSAITAVEDLLLRTAFKLTQKYSRRSGEGKSGLVSLPRPGPIIIVRSASRVFPRGEDYRARLLVWTGLPSRRRRVLGSEARGLLLDSLPRLALEARDLLLSSEKLRLWCRTYRRQEHIRSWMGKVGLVAFVADNSILPRKCGGCEEPLEDAVPFVSPPSLRVEAPLIDGGSISGMGLRKGLTLVVGPAFHGKTTLLEAISRGVWNHIPGDGREYVITRRDAVTVKSENGRSVACVDMRSWLLQPPSKNAWNRECFSTSDASGATSVAASIQEAVEAGSKLLLLDEDETATNILHRDVWVEEYTGKRSLRTVPDLVEDMKRKGISLVIVASGALPLLAKANTIIVMDEYRARDASSFRGTARLKASEAGLLRDEPYMVPRERLLSLGRLPEKWKLRGYQLEMRGVDRLVDLEILAEQIGEYRQLETAVRAALQSIPSGEPEPTTRIVENADRIIRRLLERRDSPGNSEVRAIDVLIVANRLPIIRSMQSS